MAKEDKKASVAGIKIGDLERTVKEDYFERKLPEVERKFLSVQAALNEAAAPLLAFAKKHRLNVRQHISEVEGMAIEFHLKFELTDIDAVFGEAAIAAHMKTING